MQDYLSMFDDIVNGFIKTNRGKYYCIMEIFPTNFHDKSPGIQNRIIANYSRLARAFPVDGHIYSTSEVTNTRRIIDRIMTACPPGRGKKMVAIRNDYIRTVQKMAVAETVTYRYFYIFGSAERAGVQGKGEKDILRKMRMLRATISDIFAGCGNLVANPENPDLYTLDILYKFFNRVSYRTEPILSRILRVNADCERAGIKPTIRDYIAPRGLVLNYSPDIMMMDGMYFTYLAMEDIAYPDYLPPDWLNSIQCAAQMDVHFFHHRLPHDSTLKMLKKKNFWGKELAKEMRNADRREDAEMKIGNNMAIARLMAQGEELLDCSTVLVIYREDPKELIDVRDSIRDKFNTVGTGMQTEYPYYDMEEFFKMTLPIVNFDNSVFKRTKRNFTTSSFATTYCMTQYNLFDDTDRTVVYGKEENGTMVAVNKFNKYLHPNPHMVLVGTSGAGKTWTELALGRRDMVMGIKAYYIVPVKCVGYRDPCTQAGGTYLSFTPDAKDVPNPMELYPETGTTQKDKRSSVLSKKIRSLCTFIRMLAALDGSGKYVMSTLDLNRIAAILKRLYADFGMTEDNESIWEDKRAGKKKIMPLFGYWYKRMLDDDRVSDFADLLVPFVSGIFKNFNRQSHMDLSADMIVCDVDVDQIGEELHPAVMYLAFITMSDLIKSDINVYQSLYLDEVWHMMINSDVGKIINTEIRVLREYHGSVVCASQMINEFTSNEYGQAIMANSSIKIVMKLEEEEYKRVAAHISMDESDGAYVQKAHSGDMLIISNGSRTRCHLELSLDERIVYETDDKEREKLIAQRNMLRKIQQAKMAEHGKRKK